MNDSATAGHPTGKAISPFQIKGTAQTLLCLRLLDPDHPRFMTLLTQQITHSPAFFKDAPLLIDVGALGAGEPIDLSLLVGELKKAGLQPIGIQNATSAWTDAATEAGLVVFPAGRDAAASADLDAQRSPAVAEPEPKKHPLAYPTVTSRRTQNRAAQSPPPEAAPPPAPARGPSFIVREPVRGGQQIAAADGDMVILASVGNGAEIAAAGHIHVYGTLRGRAFAGVNGDEHAMIFCDNLAADLVSIAGIFMVNDDIDPAFLGKRVMIRCDGRQLIFSTFA